MALVVFSYLMLNKNWNIKYGSWWAFQWQFDGWLSLGVHVDVNRRVTGRDKIRYGPYIDFHLGPCILSLGVNPIYSTEIDSTGYRGGYIDRP